MSDKQREIDIIGCQMDLGAGRRGVDMGPSALRVAALGPRLAGLGHTVVDRGDVPVEIMETQSEGEANIRYLPSIRAACAKLSERVAESLSAGRTPLVLGGDHSINIGTMAGYSHAFRDSDDERGVGLLWIDAHADMNTPETSPSGNVHGMPLAVALGHGHESLVDMGVPGPHVDPRDVVLVGIRDVDVSERPLVRQSGIRTFTMRDLDERGAAEVLYEAMRILKKKTRGFHVTFDADGLDPEVAPGVGTPVQGGISYREAHLMMEIVAESGGMLGFEITEVNPLLDRHNGTAEMLTELALSAFGKTIL